jgi:hypothetical protein
MLCNAFFDLIELICEAAMWGTPLVLPFFLG